MSDTFRLDYSVIFNVPILCINTIYLILYLFCIVL